MQQAFLLDKSPGRTNQEFMFQRMTNSIEEHDSDAGDYQSPGSVKSIAWVGQTKMQELTVRGLGMRLTIRRAFGKTKTLLALDAMVSNIAAEKSLCFGWIAWETQCASIGAGCLPYEHEGSENDDGLASA